MTKNLDNKDKPKEYRMYIQPHRARYITRMLARLQLPSPVNFINLCIDYFWQNHPGGSTVHLLVDVNRSTYVVIEHLDNGQPKLMETGDYLGSVDTLLYQLREERYPDLIFGRHNVLRKPY